MKVFDFEALETMREAAIEGLTSGQEERSEFLREYAEEISEAAARGTSAIENFAEMLDVAGDMLELSGQASAIGEALLATVDYGLEFRSSVQDLAENLLAVVELLANLSTYSQDSAETLMTLVRDEIQE